MDSSYPIISNSDGIKIKPEIMEREKLYYAIFQEKKIILVFKDSQDILHCYEIEEKDIVEKVKSSLISNNEPIEQILEEYIQKKSLKN